MFVAIGILMSIFALLEITNMIKPKTKIFYVFAGILLFMLCFRYGQGTDYNAYEVQYTSLNSTSSLFINLLDHGELGWYALLMSFKRLGCGFPVFLGILSFVMMASTIRVINKYSPYRILSLLLFYPTFYLTYYYSAIRQGIVLSIFLGFGIQWLIEKKYIKYFIMVVVLLMLHASAVVLFIIPMALVIKDKRPAKYIIAALGFMVVAGYTGILNSLAARFGIHPSYFTVSISYMAILLRAILFYIVHIMYKASRNELDSENRIEDVMYYIYVVGFIMYIMFAFSGTLSQRMTMPMKGIEIILIPMLAAKINNCRKEGLISRTKPFLYLGIGKSSILLVMAVVVLALDVEMIKNINSYLVQGNYYDWVNVFNYPYVSVFNKEDIFKYILQFD